MTLLFILIWIINYVRALENILNVGSRRYQFGNSGGAFDWSTGFVDGKNQEEI